jgi:universal stress protein A
MLASIRRILFPTDFSEPAQHAQQYAAALAERFGAELHVLHVIPPIPASASESPSSWAAPQFDPQIEIDAMKEKLTRELGSDGKTKFQTIHAVEMGFAVDEILKYVNHNEIDIVIVGTHGHTGLSRLLLGSVAEKLVRSCTCPVLTVHPTGHQFVIDNPSDSNSNS